MLRETEHVFDGDPRFGGSYELINQARTQVQEAEDNLDQVNTALRYLADLPRRQRGGKRRSAPLNDRVKRIKRLGRGL
jgi:hypothetical protein